VRASAVGFAAVFVGATVAGCGGDKSSSGSSTASSSSATSSSTLASSGASSSTSATAAAPDYSNLLIKPSDIGPEATSDGPPIANPGGVTGTGQTFRNPDGKRIIVDTVAVYPDPAAAAPMIPAMKDELGKKITGPSQPVDVGFNGFMVVGQSADPSKQMEISEVVFTEGRALVDLEFDCSVGNPTPNDVVLDLARKQDAAIKNGLPG
jgi:hypothetical protein